MRRLAMIAALTGLIAASCGGNSTSEVEVSAGETTQPETASIAGTAAQTTTVAKTTTIEEIEPVEITIAKASMDAWNSGDLEAYLSFFAEDAEFQKWPLSADHVRPGLEYYMALGDETLIQDCDGLSDGRVLCHCFGTNDLSGPAGVISESNWSFWITDGLITKASAAGLDLSDYWFSVRMQWWLEEAHLDVWESTFAIPERCSHEDEYNCRETWRASSETAAALLEYGPEFIAQSGEYPTTE